MKRDLRIVFMGTPEFAVPSLTILHENGYNVVGVITAPDKPAGRGRKLTGSPVKQEAERLGLKILQPRNLKAPEFIQELKELKANLQIVVAFRMLPEMVWDMPEIGTFNLHASLLPNYRGAAPINWAIINGEKETGITTFFLKHEIDTGNIILQEKEEITENDTVGSLYGRLMNKGSELVLKTVRLIENNEENTSAQNYQGNEPKAPKIFKEDCEIDWTKDSESIRNFIRGLSPYPCAWTKLNDKNLKVYSAEKEIMNHNRKPGEWESDGKEHLYFYSKDGRLGLRDVQLESKKRMSISDLLKGMRL